MSYVLEIKLQGLPKNPNGSHGHWTTASGIRKKWRRNTFLVCSGKQPKEPLEKCEVICTRFSSRKSDFDNLVASFKPIIDGLRDARIIKDDDESVIVKRDYLNAKCKPGEGHITVKVTEL